ncbi:hypothetical protein G7Y89_g7223 [Cudoniella acicularis]|uniref:DUF7580 domain-containing protein n=1 Tax=Cudoniella acicularis TaxID=354080 RepID=A0A8H4RL78_9HELO|nr:hypothetical protein G7Y89_g7223 [Cudoniella acicularis]
MVTGVETAGLVLAVLPLFISALEDYQEGLDPIKAFLDFDNRLPVHIHRLTCQYVQYELTLRLLLSGIADGNELADMLAAPFGDDWKNVTIDERLKKRLQISYPAYERTVQRMEMLMRKLAKDLTVDHTKRVDRSDLEALLARTPRPQGKFEFSRRVKFSMSRRKMKALLDELDECNRHLEGFTSKTSRLETFTSTTKPKIALPFHNRVRSYAGNLHQSICRGLNCQVSHKAKLQLEQRNKPRNLTTENSDRTKEEGPAISFGLSFSLVGPPIFASCKRQFVWQDIRVHVVSSEEVETTPRTTNASQKVVHFSNLIPSSASTACSLDLSSLVESRDICSVVRQSHSPEHCLEFSLDFQGNLRGANHVQKPRKQPKDTLTLAEVLTSAYKITMSRKERLVLGAVLASSYLQLQATPWLNSHLSKESIIFEADRDPFSQQIFSLGSPFMEHDFQKAGSQMNCENVGESLPPTNLGNISLLALGIMLMELYTGSTMETYCASASLEQWSSNPVNSLYAAHQWLEELRNHGHLSHAYVGAVHRCIQGFLDFASGDDEVGFRQSILDNVVTPTEEELRIFMGG